jgi:hypothetical protein
MRLHGRDAGEREVISTYTKPEKENRKREDSIAHCMKCLKETPHEIVTYLGRSTITCRKCGEQEEE